MPRSKKTASGRTAARESTRPISPKRAWWIVRRGSAAASCRAASTASGSMSKACSAPRAGSAASSPREWPPRPNVASTTTAAACAATIARTTSASSAGVCVPGGCTLGRKPVCCRVAGEMERRRPPYGAPSQPSACRTACSVAKVTQPTPLHLPVVGCVMRRASPTTSPAALKKRLRSSAVVSAGRYLMNTS
ncbi:hypothetical protein AB1Y20_006101 [Prymnesium parvum]|uniref:Uncharacterized protein n=1 Tax=Prymnesium parvum TaxID=97485 RepID=A0AB34J470_PRYPA